MEKQILKEIIKDSNKWWFAPFKLDYFKQRDIYKEIQKYLGKKQIIALTGLRRVGKTTLMLKIIEDSLVEIDSKNIFYFSFDEFSDTRIKEIIKVYEEIINKDISNEKYIFFFDEIQKVQNWEEQLKRLYDTYKNIKFVISGSESLFIKKKSKESLAGRIFEFRINQLSFKEFLKFKNIYIQNIELQKKQILKEFKNYLITNGFPELIKENKEFCIQYIKEGIIEKIIYRDLTNQFKIQNPSILISIFRIIYENPGSIIQIQNLSKDIGITRQKLSQYLYYLEESFLIKKLYNYSTNQRKIERKLKKYYPSIINPHLIKIDFGKTFENLMVLELNAEFFWRDSYKNEVDIISIKNGILPMEIKSGKIKNIRPILKFMKNFKLKKGIIISYDTEKNLKEIKIIPFYKYLLNK